MGIATLNPSYGLISSDDATSIADFIIGRIRATRGSHPAGCAQFMFCFGRGIDQ